MGSSKSKPQKNKQTEKIPQATVQVKEPKNDHDTVEYAPKQTTKPNPKDDVVLYKYQGYGKISEPTYRLTTPNYHPRANGVVERYNESHPQDDCADETPVRCQLNLTIVNRGEFDGKETTTTTTTKPATDHPCFDQFPQYMEMMKQLYQLELENLQRQNTECIQHLLEMVRQQQMGPMPQQMGVPQPQPQPQPQLQPQPQPQPQSQPQPQPQPQSQPQPQPQPQPQQQQQQQQQPQHYLSQENPQYGPIFPPNGPPSFFYHNNTRPEYRYPPQEYTQPSSTDNVLYEDELNGTRITISESPNNPSSRNNENTSVLASGSDPQSPVLQLNITKSRANEPSKSQRSRVQSKYNKDGNRQPQDEDMFSFQEEPVPQVNLFINVAPSGPSTTPTKPPVKSKSKCRLRKKST